MGDVSLWCLELVEVGFAHGALQRGEEPGDCLLVIPDMRAVEGAGAAIAAPAQHFRRRALRAFEAVELAVFCTARRRAANQRALGGEKRAQPDRQAAGQERIGPGAGCVLQAKSMFGEVIDHAERVLESRGVGITQPEAALSVSYTHLRAHE